VTSNDTVAVPSAGSSTHFWRSTLPSAASATWTRRAGYPVERITASMRTTVRTNANSSASTRSTATSLSPGRAIHTVWTRVSSERRKSRIAPSPSLMSPVAAPSDSSTTPARSRPS
jgi:hypothetical protein